MNELRETFVALPTWEGDIYRRHQLVWRAMHGLVRSGRQFLFAGVSPQIVRVRSAWLDQGDASAFCEGWLRVALVAARQVAGSLSTIRPKEVPGWAESLLNSHGMQAAHVEVQRTEDVFGRKLSGGVDLAIQLPVAHLLVRVRIANRAKADLAWANGIGRGKRFGYGMLLPAR